MKNSIKILIGIIIIAIIVILFTIFNSITGNAVKDDEKTIKIGSILILSNADGSNWGIATKNGIDLAVSDINSKGGINARKVEVVYQDDMGDPTKSINAFRNLVDVKNINIILGPTWTPSGLALMNLARDNKILMISPTLGVKEFNEGSKYLFNTWPHDYLLSKKLAEKVYNDGHRKVIIVGAQQPWVKDQTDAFTKRFSELGGKVDSVLEPDPNTREVTTEALKIKSNTDADAIVATSGSMAIGVQVIKRTREVGVTLPAYSVTVDNYAIDASDGAYNGMIFLTSLTPTNEFKKRYEETYNMKINIGADSGYDSMMLIAKAMNDTKSTDTTVLSDYLSGIKEYDGVSGHLVSDGKRGFTKEFKVMKVINGKGVEI
jgi:branched-chain amino acid transport system substrate-binding protein